VLQLTLWIVKSGVTEGKVDVAAFIFMVCYKLGRRRERLMWLQLALWLSQCAERKRNVDVCFS